MAVNLKKGGVVSLKKSDGSPLKEVFLGLGWDPAKKKNWLGITVDGDPIDLDASCIVFDTGGNEVDAIWFKKKQSNNNSIRHSGDNLTGEGDGDDEVIKVDLEKIDPRAKTLVFTINSYRGQSFKQIANTFVRVVDRSTDKEEIRYELSETQDRTAVIIAKISRTANGWEMKAVGEFADGSTYQQLVLVAKKFL